MNIIIDKKNIRVIIAMFFKKGAIMVVQDLSFEDVLNTIGKNDLFERTDTQCQMYYTKNCDFVIDITRDKNNKVVFAFCKSGPKYKNFVNKYATEISDTCQEKFLLNEKIKSLAKTTIR